MRAVQLTWSNWNQVCEFVPESKFVSGVFLDASGNPSTGFSFESGAMGLVFIGANGEKVIARENEWLVKDVAGNIHVKKVWVN